jgi:hypothetical protein
MRKSIITALTFAVSLPALADTLPVNPAVTPSNIDETICVSGYSHSVRPPYEVTNAIKHELIRQSGLPSEAIHDFTLDHAIPISVGGAPDDIRNLKLEPKIESKTKDRIEFCIYRAVCEHRVGLREAQAAIWSDWRKAKGLCGGRYD